MIPYTKYRSLCVSRFPILRLGLSRNLLYSYVILQMFVVDEYTSIYLYRMTDIVVIGVRLATLTFHASSG